VIKFPRRTGARVRWVSRAPRAVNAASRPNKPMHATAHSVPLMYVVELVQELDRRFFQALDKTVKIESIPGGIALGASFLQGHWRDATHALEGALEFRESRSGRQVRGFFRELVDLGRASNKQAIEDRLGDLEALLQDAARNRFGTSWTADPKAGFLLGLLGSWKDVLAPALTMVPRRIREAVTRVLYTSTHDHGFQILFKRYL
jgi:hypothetical protein